MASSAMECSIREASLQDLHVLVRIIRESFRDVARRFALTEENCPRHPSNCTSEWIESAMQKGIRYFVLESDGTPCGCAALERARPEVYYLERLSVLPEYRGRGYGRMLVDHALLVAAVEGAHQVEIGIISDQSELKEWYLRAGFIETGKASFPHLPFEVAFMARVLDVAG